MTQYHKHQDFIQTHLTDYKLVRPIGAGGMGSVFLAQDLRLQRKVAIKLLNLTSSLGIDERLKEARALARLNHPHVVQIYQVLEFDEYIALVMEYLDGPNLLVLQQEKLISFEQKLAWLIQVAQGLSAAHRVGVIHCDLKLSNIILVGDQVKLVDFGISYVAEQGGFNVNEETSRDIHKGKNIHNGTDIHKGNSQGHKLNTSYGSQASMAPEQLLQQQIDFRADLFSFGVMAFGLLIAQHPFGNGASADTAKRIISGRAMDARHVTPALPASLALLLNRLLAHNREQRPQDAIEVIQCLEQILINVTQEAILAEKTMPLEDIEQPSIPIDISRVKLNRLIKPTLTGASVLCILLIGFYLWSLWTEEQPRQVVVLRPEFIQSEQMATIQQDLVRGTLDDALRQSVLYGRNMNLISYKETKKYSAKTNQMAQVTGATDIITTELDCNQQRCEVVFSRLSGENWTVAAQQRWPITIESYVNVFTAAQGQFGRLFTDYRANELVQPHINEQDYLSYVQLYHQIQFKRQNDEQSLLQLKQLLQRSPYLYAGYRLFRENARQLYSQNQNKTYLDQLQQLIENSPPQYRYSVFAAIDKYWLAITREDYQQAKQQLEIAQQRDINPSTLLEMQAHRHRVNHQPQRSIEYYQKALSLRPNVRLYYHLAVAYFWLSEMEQAKSALAKITDILPHSYDANQLLGTIHLMQGDTNQAINAYKKFVTDDARSIDLSNLGLAYTLQGQHQQALVYATKAVAKGPSHPTWLLNLADAQTIVGMQPQALANYHKVLQLNQGKKQVKAWLELAQAHVHLDAKEEAVKALNQAKKLAPDSVEVSFTAALVYAKLNENISALIQIEEALNKGFGGVWFNLPWFDHLCGNQKFKQLMIAHHNQDRCN